MTMCDFCQQPSEYMTQVIDLKEPHKSSTQCVCKTCAQKLRENEMLFPTPEYDGA